MKSHIEYTLDTPIEVDIKGDKTLAENIVINSPSGKNKRICMVLESIYYQALKNNISIHNDVKGQSSASVNEDKEEDPYEIISHILKMGANKEIVGDLLNTFCEIMCSGNTNDPTATIDGVKFTVPLFDQLSHKDTQYLIGRYIADFLSVT